MYGADAFGRVTGRVGRLGDLFTVAPGDCGADAETVTGLLWQLRNPSLPAIGGNIIPPAACYVSPSDIALVKQVQTTAGLPQTGVVDDDTLMALTQAANAATHDTGAVTQGGPPQITADPLTITAPRPGSWLWLAAAAYAAWKFLK